MLQDNSRPRRKTTTALGFFDQALKIDPNDADALAGKAFTYMALFVFGEATTERISMQK